ncbi:hypothetical protein [Sporosarcina sp. UB5]|uniref:hypothetical protein n=1 Tax=Sporosarcina sp. UB5 TaxID=3047463 RepID=UPI003D78BFB4
MFQNPWIVGIGGGIISSIVVLIVKLLMNKISKKEYYGRVDEANDEVIDIFKHIISEDDFPDRRIIDSVISSTSRKNKVKIEDMNNGEMVIDSLITELFSSNFISVDKKLANSNNLLKIKDEYKVKSDIEHPYKQFYEIKMSPSWSIAFPVTVIVVGLILIFTSILREERMEIDFSLFEVLPLVVSFLSTIVGLTLITLAAKRNIMSKKNNKNKDKNNDSDSKVSFSELIKKMFL